MTRMFRTMAVVALASVVVASVVFAQVQDVRITSGPAGSTVTFEQKDGRGVLVVTAPASSDAQKVVVELIVADPGAAAGADAQKALTHERRSWWWLVVGVLLSGAYLFTFRDLVRPVKR